jgi:hypothetical protein
MKKLNAKKLGVTVLLIGALSVGAVAANAQQGNPPGGRPGQPGQMDGGRGFGQGERGFGQDGRFGEGRGFGQDGRFGGRGFGGHDLYLMQAVMDATGLNLIDIASQVRDGSSLGEIVTANGGTVEAVVADAVTGATAAINEAVADGSLSQEQADQMIAQLEATYTNILNGAARGQALERFMDVGIVRLTAELTDLNAREIAQQLADGATLSSILTDNGVAVDAFVAEATERAQARVDLHVAEDRITAEEAAELMTQFAEELNSLLNEGTATPAL